MAGRAFAPDLFAIGLLAFGLLLMVFPAMRVAGLVALTCAVLYWIVIVLLKAFRWRR